MKLHKSDFLLHHVEHRSLYFQVKCKQTASTGLLHKHTMVIAKKGNTMMHLILQFFMLLLKKFLVMFFFAALYDRKMSNLNNLVTDNEKFA